MCAIAHGDELSQVSDWLMTPCASRIIKSLEQQSHEWGKANWGSQSSHILSTYRAVMGAIVVWHCLFWLLGIAHAADLSFVIFLSWCAAGLMASIVLSIYPKSIQMGCHHLRRPSGRRSNYKRKAQPVGETGRSCTGKHFRNYGPGRPYLQHWIPLRGAPSLRATYLGGVIRSVGTGDQGGPTGTTSTTSEPSMPSDQRRWHPRKNSPGAATLGIHFTR